MYRSNSFRIIGLKCVFTIFTIFQVFYNTDFVSNASDIGYHLAYVRLFLILICLLLCIDVILYSTRNFFLFLISAIVMVLNLRVQGYNELFYLGIIIFLLPILQVQVLLKIDFFARLFTTLFICIFSSFLGNGNVFDMTTGHLRFALGFSNPNALSQVLLVLAMEAILLTKYLNKYFVILIESLTFLLICFVARSRTSTILWVLFIIGSATLKQKSFFLLRHKILRLLVLITPFLFFMGSYVLSYRYLTRPTNNMLLLNKLLSNRLQLSSFYLGKYGISLFGQKIETSYIFTNFGSLDNGYMSLLVRFGVIPSILVIGLMSLTLYKLSTFKNSSMCLAFLTFVFMGLSETIFYMPCYNITLFFCGFLLTNKIASMRFENTISNSGVE